MSDNPFLDALRSSLGGTKTSFDVADTDLSDAVREASEAVGEVTSGKLRLALDPRVDNIHGRVYDLDLMGLVDGPRTIGSFHVRHNGYPVTYGKLRNGVFNDIEPLYDSEGVRNYLVGMMSNPDSPLTVSIAFGMRQNQSEDDFQF
jgi:hypothetical protein